MTKIRARYSAILLAILVFFVLLFDCYPDFGGHYMTTDDVQQP